MRTLFLLVAALPLYSQITVDTFAGGAIRSGVPAKNVYLESIAGVAWDAAGNVVFCDQTNHVIRRVRADGTLDTIAGTGVTGFAGDGGQATAALLNAPASPHYDSSGNLYFVDTLNYRVRRIDAQGVITTVAGDGVPFATGMDTGGPALERSLNSAIELAVAPSGALYILDATLGTVRIVTTGGLLRDFANLTTQDAQISSPTVDGSGNLFLLATYGYQHSWIARIAADGTQSKFREWQATHDLSVAMPSSLTADATGNVYAVRSNSIVRFGADGTDTAIAGGATGIASSSDGAAAGSTLFPYELAVDSQGNVAFAEGFTFANYYLSYVEIRVVTSSSQLKTLAGNAPQIAADGTALRSAWFQQPQAIAFSRAGDLYVAEFRACLIRKISAAGVLSTFAGTGNCAYPAPTGTNAKTADIVQPYSLAVDSQNRVWVTDYYGEMYSIAQDGTISTIVKTPVIGGKGLLAVDAKDRVYVLGLDSLYRVLADGTYTMLAPTATTPMSLTGIGADSSGTIYFSTSGRIYTVNDDGSFKAVSSSGTGGATSLAIDPAQRIWQGGAAGLGFYSAAGVGALGNLHAGYSGDGGPAMVARFTNTSSIALSPAGDLYGLDGTRIRKLTGLSSTVATPTVSAGGIVNAASYASASIAPGELVAIFGSNFGTDKLLTATTENSVYPLSLGRARVWFNGNPAPLVAVAPNQINVFVPYSYLGSLSSVPVVVEVDGALSSAVTMTVAAAAPGLFTSNASGSGQGAILNQDGSLNSTANPAARGSIVVIYGTGLGKSTPQLSEGALAISTPYPAPQNAVSVSIGGQAAEVLYAGTAPGMESGVFQINARVPATISAGNAAVSVSAGGIASAGQVTVAVK